MINFNVGNLLSLRESTKTGRPELLSDMSKQVQLLWEIAAQSTVHLRLNRKEHPLQTPNFPPAALLFLSPTCFCLSLASPAKLRWSRRCSLMLISPSLDLSIPAGDEDPMIPLNVVNFQKKTSIELDTFADGAS